MGEPDRLGALSSPAGPVPEFGQARRGTLLDRLDRQTADSQAEAKSRRAPILATASARALALLRGEPDPEPNDEPEAEDDPDPQVKAALAANLAKLHSGEHRPISTRRIDYDPQTRAYTSQVSRRGGPWSRPEVIATSRPPVVATSTFSRRPACTSGRPPAARREARPGRRRVASSARAGPDDGDGSGSESDDESDALERDWLAAAGWKSGRPARRLAERLALFPEPVTPLTLALAVEAAYGLRGPSRAAACILTYRRLPERLQRGYDAAARREGHASGAIVA